MHRIFSFLSILFFALNISGQKPIMLERYFNYLKTNKDKTELIERIKNYTDYLKNKEKKKQLKQIAFVFEEKIKLENATDSFLWRNALLRYASNCNKQLSDFESALKFYLMAHDLAVNKIFYDTLAWHAENEISNIYNRFGDLEQTQYFQNITEKSLRHFQENESLSRFMVNKAQLQLDQQDTLGAIHSYQEGFFLAKKIHFSQGIVANNIQLGILYIKLGKIKEAIECNVIVQREITGLKDHKHYFKYLSEAGDLKARIQTAQNKFTEAIKLYEKSENDIQNHYKDHRRRESAKLAIERIKLYHILKEYEKSVELVDSTIAAYIPIKKRGMDADSMYLYPDNIFVDLYVLKARASFEAGNLMETVKSLENAIYVNRLLWTSYIDSPSKLSAIAHNKKIVGQALDVLYEMQLRGIKGKTAEKLRLFLNQSKGQLLDQKLEENKNLNKLSYEDRRELKKTEAGIYHIYAEEYWKSDSRDHLTKLKAQRNKILEAAGLAGESKSSNRAKNYIEFSFSEKYLYRYSWINGDEKFIRLGVKDEAISINFQLRQAIQNKAEMDAIQRQAWSFFFKELKNPLPDRLLIIPDEILFELPFDLLKSPSGKLLIETTTAWYHYRDREYKDIIAKPSIDIISPRYTGQNEIPAAIKEVETIHKLFTATTTEVITGKKQSLINGGQGEVFHFTGHAVNQRQKAYLLLSDSLKMYDTEISNTRVNKKMVYLSACTTGLGEVEKGEGLRSLCKSFLEAGVPTVVQSQWEVNAEAGTEITGEFYRLMSQGLPAIEALRQAKLNYWKNANLSEKHPYYWAAFVLVGNDLEFKENKLMIYLSLGLGLLVFLFINYLIKRR